MNNQHNVLKNNEYEYNYIEISEYPLKQRNLVYHLHINTPIKINGIDGYAKNIELGDTVIIPYANSYSTITVNDFEFSKYSTSSCFTGDCKIRSLRGLIQVNELKIGDKILNSSNNFSEIKCILENKIDKIINMYIYKELIITDYHPVKINSKWQFPIDCEIFKKINIKVDSLYSIGLIDDTSFLIDDIEVIGLGHGITDDIVASHEYFGTTKVINDIFSISSNGYCKITPNHISRDSITGLINGIVYIL